MPLLFSNASIFDVIQHQQQMLKEEIEELDSSALNSVPGWELVHSLASKYKMEVPALAEENAYISHREAKVDVSRDPMRLIFDRSQPFYVKGVEITFSVPFRGDPNFFLIRPTTFTVNPPRAEIAENEIQFVFTRLDNDAQAARTEYERGLTSVKQHLGWLQASVEEFNRSIGPQVEGLVAQRQLKVSETAGMVASLGLPVKQKAAKHESAPAQPAKSFKKSISSPKKWDVFISHASEDKTDFATPLAEALRARGVSVWYDDFSLKLGDSLRSSIDFGLVNSRYGVVIFSKNFFAKHWPAQELNGLANREANGRKVILPIWHKVTADEVRQFSPILADRLAASSSEGVEKLVDQVVQVLEED
jgi:TIR domain-containing protein